jgi:hypothetical protein
MKANENMHEKFYCDKCDYKCSKKYLWNQHIMTRKHVKANFPANEANEKYACSICNTIFKHQSSYCRHKKKCIDMSCNDFNIEIKNKEETEKNLIMMLIKQNRELLEVIKNGTYNINNITNNSNNKTFNLNFFLNETCKDAMNIMDFVDSIKLQLTDLIKVGEVGYVEGISNIIVKNLNALNINERPIHCTDKKREVIYIKDENRWEKEDENKIKIRKAINKVASKNQRLISQFKEKYPGCNYSESKYSDQYNKLVVEAMGGSGDNDIEKENKIIHNISKNVIIDKI